MTCVDQVASQKCDSPWLRQLDLATKTVIQYCADVCGCNVTSSMVTTPGAEPPVVRMDGGQLDMVNGCCKW